MKSEVKIIVKKEMAQPSSLLECVAARIGESLFSNFPLLKSVEIKMMKRNPPMGDDCEGACVELHLINDKTEELPFGFS